MPTLTGLLERMLGDLETIQKPAKRVFGRPSLFLAEPAETCFRPEPWVAASGSYPSGHSAMGWAWALALSEMAPDRADQILARGLAYGDSRAIYVSDVEGGRILGAARFAALKADPAFQANFATARLELARERRLPMKSRC